MKTSSKTNQSAASGSFQAGSHEKFRPAKLRSGERIAGLARTPVAPLAGILTVLLAPLFAAGCGGSAPCLGCDDLECDVYQGLLECRAECAAQIGVPDLAPTASCAEFAAGLRAYHEFEICFGEPPGECPTYEEFLEEIMMFMVEPCLEACYTELDGFGSP